MIKLRLNPLTSKTETLKIIKNESIQDTFERAKEKFPQINQHTEEFYKAYLYGHEVPRDTWHMIKPKEPQNLMFGVIPQSGSSGRFLGQVAILAVVIATTVATKGQAAQAWAPALAGFGASLVVNALIKPPAAGLAGAFGSGYGSEESQTYTISNQSNSVNKFGIVPKVYGTHRIFPNIAANPYTEFFADNGGELSQYFYAVYDFGLGPAQVTDLRIGNTPLTEFSEISYRFVDLNKPSTSEGVWDDQLNTAFELYKGDNNTETLGLNLNSDSNVGAPADEYIATRNAEPNPNNYDQEILLQFVCPNGLRTIDTAGNNLTRNIELICEFAEEGTEDWKSFNDVSVVNSFSSVGQVIDESQFVSTYFGQRVDGARPALESRYLRFLDVSSVEITNTQASYYSRFFTFNANQNYPPVSTGTTGIKRYFYDTYKYAKGNNVFYSSKVINNGAAISYGGSLVGKIIQVDDMGGFYRYTLDQPFKQDIILFSTVVFEEVISAGGGAGGGPVVYYKFSRHLTWATIFW
jgi:hypothetical protein